MPLWLRRSISKYNAMYPNDEPDAKLIDADPPIRKATVKSYNPVTKQAIVEFGNESDVFDGDVLDTATMINDPEHTSSSSVDSSSPSEPAGNSDSDKTSPASADMKDQLVKEAQKLLEECFHCGMADYEANPFGNPFDDQMVTDLANPLVEY